MTPGFDLTPRPPQKSSRVVLLASAAVVVVVVIAALVVWAVNPGTVEGKAVMPAGSAAFVDGDDLEPLLVSPDEVSKIVGVPNMVTISSWMKPDTNDEAATPEECVGALYTGMDSVYADNGYASIFQTRTGPNKSNSAATPAVNQTVAAFDTAQEAQKALTDYLRLIEGCAGKDLTFTKIQVTWHLGSPEQTDDGITVASSRLREGTLFLDRSVTAKGNVLVEVQIQDNKSHKDDVLAITRDILQNIGS